MLSKLVVNVAMSLSLSVICPCKKPESRSDSDSINDKVVPKSSPEGSDSFASQQDIINSSKESVLSINPLDKPLSSSEISVMKSPDKSPSFPVTSSIKSPDKLSSSPEIIPTLPDKVLSSPDKASISPETESA